MTRLDAALAAAARLSEDDRLALIGKLMNSDWRDDTADLFAQAFRVFEYAQALHDAVREDERPRETGGIFSRRVA